VQDFKKHAAQRAIQTVSNDD